MGKDLNLRQQRFVVEYIKHGVQSRAYLAAGYQASSRLSLDAMACRLSRNVKVQAAIRQKRQQIMKKSDVTIDSLLLEAEEARGLALRSDQASAAIAATALKGKLTGLLVDRKESGAPGDFAGLSTKQEVLDALRAELGDAAAELIQRALTPPQGQGEAIKVEPNDTIN